MPLVIRCSGANCSLLVHCPEARPADGGATQLTKWRAAFTVRAETCALTGIRTQSTVGGLVGSAYVQQRDGSYWVTETRVSLDSIVFAFLSGQSAESIAQAFPV